jgi:hypothetical protein
MRDRYGRAPRSLPAPLTGIEERGMYARVAQEPGMESRGSCRGQERHGKEKSEPIGRREVGARNMSHDVGELVHGEPCRAKERADEQTRWRER